MKFLKKKGVRIGAIVAAALLLVLIIYFCVRPVSVGYSYTTTYKNLAGKDVTQTYHFNDFKKLTTSVDNHKGMEFNYIEHKGTVYIVGDVNMTKEQMDDAKKLIEKGVAPYDNFEINAFTFDHLRTYTCVGAIVSVVIMAVVELGLVALIVLSFKSKGKKKRK